MPDTPYVETEALLFAIKDLEAGSDNYDSLDKYLRENFLLSELQNLSSAAQILSNRAYTVWSTWEW